ncbi:hypothetical protein G6F70_004561 [Rhizopus microsporus]|nr:hypothetical protein G6F71_004646 [Rhizopus microsporus]KAG1199848.1 hypothetical protein G6F70_004561 [Rhizopus microsporus]KAG1211528.1 hypothetical protein G6F69_004519 [Rhizopus microsporus]KAG1233465.1 hypothetical protein G6F67_004255 [Rhizopus microsporus]KAG1265469.1 hypothetical protein G6F68_003552 [Rhizopus microsporus]
MYYNSSEQTQFELHVQHPPESGSGLYMFTDESDQHYDTLAKQVDITETNAGYQVDLTYFNGSLSTFDAQITHEQLNVDEDGEYDCVLYYDEHSNTFMLQRLIGQIDLKQESGSLQNGYPQDDFDFDLSRDMDEILNSQEEDEDGTEKYDEVMHNQQQMNHYEEQYNGSEEDNDNHDVFEEILPTASTPRYSPLSIAPTPRSSRFSTGSGSHRYTYTSSEFRGRSPTPLEGSVSDQSEIVGYGPNYNVNADTESDSSESESSEENEANDDDEEDDDDLDSLLNDISMTLTNNVASAPDSPRPEYVNDVNPSHATSNITPSQPHTAGPMSLRALFNDGDEEEDEGSPSNSDSD